MNTKYLIVFTLSALSFNSFAMEEEITNPNTPLIPKKTFSFENNTDMALIIKQTGKNKDAFTGADIPVTKQIILKKKKKRKIKPFNKNNSNITIDIQDKNYKQGLHKVGGTYASTFKNLPKDDYVITAHTKKIHNINQTIFTLNGAQQGEIKPFSYKRLN